MNNKVFIGLVVLAAGVLVGWFFLKGPTPTGTEGDKTTQESTPAGSNLPPAPDATGEGDAMEKGGVAARTVVVLSDGGFAPLSVTVKSGTVVSFVNEGDGQMWVASAPHPTHSILPDFDQKASVGNGGTYEYTFTRVGTWKFHNHAVPSQTGTVIVTE